MLRNLATLWIKTCLEVCSNTKENEIVVWLELWYFLYVPKLLRFIIRFAKLLSDTTFAMRFCSKHSCLDDWGNFLGFCRSRCHFKPAGSSSSCRREIVLLRVRLSQPCIFPSFIRLWLNDIILNVLHMMFCFFTFPSFSCNKYKSKIQSSTGLWSR